MKDSVSLLHVLTHPDLTVLGVQSPSTAISFAITSTPQSIGFPAVAVEALDHLLGPLPNAHRHIQPPLILQK